jgi:outer membrane protein assembly factor BamD
MSRSTVAVLVTALAIPALGLTTLGCGATEKRTTGGILQYSEGARRAYEEAMVAFKDRDWLEAQARLRDVRRRFSFSEYSPLAQLRLADIEFEQEKWIEAISAYKGFNRENPRHPQAGWAHMRIARSYYNEISDALLLPAQEERDQSAVVEASREIQQYLEEYPEGPEHEQMKVLGANALARLVDHELYVARFYMGRGKLDAALGRATYAVTKFRGSSKDVEALVVQGQVLMQLRRYAEARATFEYVMQKYPNDTRNVQAKKFLDEIEASGK